MTLQPCKTTRDDIYRTGDRVFYFDYYHYQSADKMKLATVTHDQVGPEVCILVDGEETFGDQWGLEPGRLVRVRDIFDIYDDEKIGEVERVTAPVIERVQVKLYFDANNVCLGGCCDDNWLPLYRGEEYVASEFFKLVRGFDPVGKTVKELQEIERKTNPYAIKAAAMAAMAEKKRQAEAEETLAALKNERAALIAERIALDAKKAALEAETLANTGSPRVPYSTGTYSQLAEAYQDGKVLASERVNFSDTNPGYIVLRRWGLDQWAIHYYSVVSDCFEFGQYLKDYPKARKAYKTRIEKYHK